MSIEIIPLTTAIGAEIRGVDLREPQDAATIAAIRAAWMTHQVLLFRDQDVTPEQQIRFSRGFGLVEAYPLVHYRLPGHPEIFLLSNEPSADGKPSETRNAARHWHSDLSFTARPCTGALLRCVKAPRVGGTTMWANQTLAYERLSPTFRRVVDGLYAVHELFSKTKDLKNLDQGQIKDMKRANPRIAQPMVRVHDETGRAALYVSEAVTTQIVGMDRDESDAILEFLFRHQVRPEFTMRHQWRP
ncbi:MAG: TauD/TfdA dioxygenase family protein, partial [Burkholderiaceae bacterium]